ncbi:aryl hydrocarbon receptor nuclear translocator homolog isoform X3 [Rhopilema esculentum]|uniref:aryl hydrocarbon receptor nuclear translocator homolog isoform X3 n=1 Tax=Rhopilema esculentum TaxID=499914 RepID=UPI0031D40939
MEPKARNRPGHLNEPSDNSSDSANKGGRLRKRSKNIKEEEAEEDNEMMSVDPHGIKVSKYETKEQTKERFARENHSEIERRRRNKMNAYINELSDMVPTCNGLPKKPDKLTILKMAVTYIKSLRGGSPPPTDGNSKPSFLSDQELKHLVLEAADGFLFVLSCTTGRVVYVSDSITPVLNKSQEEWINQSIYDLIHPEDRDKLKDQLGTELSHETRVLDPKTGSVRKDGGPGRLGVGSRRNFIIRMKCGIIEDDIESVDSRMNEIKNRCKEKRKTYDGEDYAFIHCTGYVPNFSPVLTQDIDQEDGECCLVCIGRMQSTTMATAKDNEVTLATEFITRQTTDGRFSFVDQAVTEILGYKPIELLGKNCYEFYHPENQEEMFANFKQVLSQKGQPLTAKFKFRHKNGEYIVLRASCYSFQNPYTDEPEYIICTNSPVRNRLDKVPVSTKSEPDSSVDSSVPSSPQYNDVSSKFQEMPGSFPYPHQAVDSRGFSQGNSATIVSEDDSDRGKSSKRKSGAGKNRKTKSGKLEYGGALERMPTDEKFMQQSPFVDFSNSQAGEMLRALARRQQEQTQTSIGKPPTSQYDQAMYGASQPNWPGAGQFNLPGSDNAYDYMDSSAVGSSRGQSSPYNLPVSEINLARQMLQSSGSRGFEQSARGQVPYGHQQTPQSMPSPNAQQQKLLNYQQQQQMGQQRPSDMQFPYY